jgi:hypothetical protein
MKRFEEYVVKTDVAHSAVDEDAAGNSAGGGGVAGLGVGPQGEPGVDLRKRKKQIEQMAAAAKLNEATKAQREAAAKEVHARWMEFQKEQGHDSHKSPDGEEEYMVDYDQLTEPAKDLDRMAVDAVLDTLGEDTDPRC